MKRAAVLNWKQQAANCITICRMIGAVVLLTVRPLSPIFYGLYTCMGLTDVLDGVVARATKSTSEFGAKLDSAADLLFFSVTFVRLFPALRQRLPVLIWYFVAAILALRLTSYLTAAVKYGKVADPHTPWNKLTGGMLFAIPYLIGIRWLTSTCYVAAALAAFAAADELIRNGRADR